MKSSDMKLAKLTHVMPSTTTKSVQLVNTSCTFRQNWLFSGF